MANEPLESIKFPGIADTFTVPAVDNTLAVQGAPADAKKVGDEISDIKADLSEISEVHGSKTVDVYEYTPVELNLGAGSWTYHGVVFTQNNDGTISAVGTNTHTSGIIFGIRSSSAELTIPLTAGEKYRLTGCPVGGAASGGYSLTIRLTSGGGPLARDIGEGVIIDITETTTYKIHITVAQGLTINKVFTPKLEKMTVVGQETVDVLTAKDDVARDGKVDKQQGVENAGKALVVGSDGLVELMDDSGSGLSSAAKTALLECFRHVVWTDDDDDYYTALEEALDVLPQRYLTVVYNPENHTVYTDDSLDTLKPYLTVTYHEGTTETTLSDNDYSLNGSLQSGVSSVNALYGGLSKVFDVTAVDFYNDIFKWEYKLDGSGNLKKLNKDAFDMNIGSTLRGIFTGSAQSFSKVRTFVTEKGKAPMRINASPYSYFEPYMYPIPVPKTASKVTCTITPSNYKLNVFLFRYLNDQTLTEYDYTQISSKINQTTSATINFTAGENMFLALYVNNSDTTSIVTEPEIVVQFS